MGSIAVSTFALIFWLNNQVGYLHGSRDPAAPVPIPARSLGMVLGNGSASAPVQIEVFLELLCPDSFQAWTTLKRLSRTYDAAKVRIVIHQFPLPYHSNGFVVTQTFFQVAHVKPDMASAYMEQIFRSMGGYSTGSTMDNTPNAVLRHLAARMSALTGMDKEQILSNHDRYYGTAITAWKYGARRGVAGTPWHFVNGVELSQNGESLSLEDYRAIIDPLMRRNDVSPTHSFLIVDGPTNATPFASLVSHQVVLILLTVSSLVVL
ncbi:hypothetical protein NP493_1468g00023 [Ridgeia piscesae]|uniref:Thioredoxin-like fold domain-containing protein n=1 Tax=Ridgeia piscesae TaxID=27915 RepID=A0AAD9K3D9_RIDPI|nr:hypothetical protein NP493_1468g00023 [Ridgeia piscesae]